LNAFKNPRFTGLIEPEKLKSFAKKSCKYCTEKWAATQTERQRMKFQENSLKLIYTLYGTLPESVACFTYLLILRMIKMIKLIT